MAKRLHKILIYSNSPHSSTGYSVQISQLAKFLKADGYEVAIAANSGVIDQALHWNDIDIYPSRGNPFDFGLVHDYATHFNADVILSLYDVWPFPEDVRKQMGKPWIAWIPVDGSPPPGRLLNAAKQSEWRLAMSKFGQKELEQAGIDSTYVPLGVDCDVFCPGSKEESRERLGFPQDAFVVGVVAANKGWPCRKSWPELMMAFSHFNRRFPRNTLLYLHTTRVPYGAYEGANIDRIVNRVGIPRDVVQVTAESDIGIGVPDETMVDLYRSFDVLLNPAMGEGFGVPIIEAQACGTPVITQNCSAMTETTIIGHCLDPLQPFYVPQLDYWWHLASVPRIVEALVAEYQAPSTRDERAVKQAVHKIRQRYHWPDLYERCWKPVLSQIEAELW